MYLYVFSACDDNGLKYLHNCYTFYSSVKTLTWPQAEATCRVSGGNLVSIMNQDEMIFIHYMLTTRWRTDLPQIYIGIHSTFLISAIPIYIFIKVHYTSPPSQRVHIKLVFNPKFLMGITKITIYNVESVCDSHCFHYDIHTNKCIFYIFIKILNGTLQIMHLSK